VKQGDCLGTMQSTTFFLLIQQKEREREGDMQNKERDMLGRKQERDVKWVKA
jgi:hypothetical protein